jgi:hypothetical protein
MAHQYERPPYTVIRTIVLNVKGDRKKRHNLGRLCRTALRARGKVAGRAGVKVAEFAGWLPPKAPRGWAWLRSNRPTPAHSGLYEAVERRIGAGEHQPSQAAPQEAR